MPYFFVFRLSVASIRSDSWSRAPGRALPTSGKTLRRRKLGPYQIDANSLTLAGRKSKLGSKEKNVMECPTPLMGSATIVFAHAWTYFPRDDFADAPAGVARRNKEREERREAARAEAEANAANDPKGKNAKAAAAAAAAKGQEAQQEEENEEEVGPSPSASAKVGAPRI